MRRRLALALLLMSGMLVTAGAAVAAAADASPPKLRRWHLGLQSTATWRDRFDVFGRPNLPSSAVSDRGRGGGGAFGYRFGDRFLLEAQITVAGHDLAGTDARLMDLEALLTGTVLFREHDTLQPFLRGGFGGGGELLELTRGGDSIISFGTAAIAGGGLQVRLGSRVSLEWELVATFNNLLEVQNMDNNDLWPEESWQVRVSNWGWRSGLGVVFWF